MHSIKGLLKLANGSFKCFCKHVLEVKAHLTVADAS